jgi:hypothetical protein
LTGWQWTFDQTSAGVLVQLLGILITIALAQLWILVQSIWYTKDNGEPSIRLDGRRNPRSLWEFIFLSIREVLDEISPPVQLPGTSPERRWSHLFRKVLLIAAAFVIFAGALAVGVVANALQGDSKVLTTSPLCGYYWIDSTRPEAQPYHARAQLEAQQYARLCYGGRKSDYKCDQFLQQSIAYETTVNDDCPFSPGMCHLGPKGAITFSTGPTPALALGVNAKRTLQFERNTTCAPVMMNSTFVEHIPGTIDGCRAQRFRYHYGYTPNSNISYEFDLFDRQPSNWPAYFTM